MVVKTVLKQKGYNSAKDLGIQKHDKHEDKELYNNNDDDDVGDDNCTDMVITMVKDHRTKSDVLEKDMLLTNNEDSKCNGIRRT